MAERFLTMVIAGLAARIALRDGAFADAAAARIGQGADAAKPALAIDLETDPAVNMGKELDVATAPDGAVEFGMHGVACRADLARGRAELRIYPDTTVLEYALKALLSALLSRNNGGLFHAAGIARDGAGYLFAGPPGAGKSTVAAIAGPGGAILNDELVAVRNPGGGHRIYGLPKWAGGAGDADLPLGAPLKACFILSHGKTETVFHEGIASERTEWLFDNISYMLPERGIMESAMGFVEELQRKTRTARMEFALGDGPRFWEVVGGYLAKKV
jgi:hypothetical protein